MRTTSIYQPGITRHSRWPLTAIAVLAACIAGGAGCGPSREAEVPARSPATAEPAEGAVAPTGARGPQRDESSPARPNASYATRIVSFGPNITETIFALGQGRRVVGVTSYCDYPPEAATLPKVGGAMDPDKEKITLLAPDLIVLQGKIQEIADLAAKNETRVVSVNMDSLASIDGGIAAIGKAVGCEAQADALRARVRDELAAVRNAVKDLPRLRVLIVTERITHDLNNLYTAGGTSFLSELVEVAGGENIYADADRPYLEASKETVVMRAPDAILEFHPGAPLTEDEQAAFVADWDQLGSLPAVRNRRVHLILESYAMRPGPRVPLVARRIAALLHPEAELPKL